MCNSFFKITFYISFILFCVKQTNAQNNPLQNISTKISLDGDSNFRDLGGIKNSKGKTIKSHKLFRSGRLASITDSDIDSIHKLGIQQIIDLRTTEQIQQTPDRKMEGISTIHLPLIEGELAGGNLIGKILKKELNGKEFMLETYTTIDSLRIASWTKIFDLLEEGKTTVWHCSSGKDRAGMTTALILASLNVTENDIFNDFTASNHFLSESNKRTFTAFEQRYGKEGKDLVRPLMVVEKEYLEAFFTTIKEKYGSVTNFLSVLDVDIKKMQKNYLE
ncbi:tyrosine-protein phosphatase [Aureivirga marina]|uniref:tyrosine-protein phosphatase n=1 Tax=Aureivirga marina TaxID=1182451 RepID=UPI0018CA687A|nr:tyrosine-protein phosphatase [Aureivirga marina]